MQIPDIFPPNCQYFSLVEKAVVLSWVFSPQGTLGSVWVFLVVITGAAVSLSWVGARVLLSALQHPGQTSSQRTTSPNVRSAEGRGLALYDDNPANTSIMFKTMLPLRTPGSVSSLVSVALACLRQGDGCLPLAVGSFPLHLSPSQFYLALYLVKQLDHSLFGAVFGCLGFANWVSLWCHLTHSPTPCISCEFLLGFRDQLGCGLILR